jgi:4-carboxymuconolactone decarboxylase
MTHPRLVPVDLEGQSAGVQASLRQFRGGASQLFRSVAHAPDHIGAWGRYLEDVLDSALAVRDREILILRTAWQCRGAYEWRQHLRLGQQAGLGRDHFERLMEEDPGPSWSPYERSLIAAADELHQIATISDDTWRVLSETLDPTGLVEVVLIVGQYHSLAYLTNSLGTPIEGGFDGAEVWDIAAMTPSDH